MKEATELRCGGGDDARESANIYEAHKNIGIPPKGAFVFYSCSGMVEGEVKNWGHVALSLGNGDAIHAWDKVRIDNPEFRKPIT